MRREVLIVAAALLVFLRSVLASVEIIGGDEVSSRQTTPFVVRMIYSDGSDCGGSIVSERWILTAGHCRGVSRVLVGTNDFKNGGTQVEVLREVLHPQFQDRFLFSTYDFLLLELKEPLQFSKLVQPIALASPDFMASRNIGAGTMATLLGWGWTSDQSNEMVDQLRQVSVPIVSTPDANRMMDHLHQLDESMIAAGLIDGGKDGCYGDSGGPLTVRDPKTNQRVQVGVASWGDGCALPRKPGVYGSIPKVYPWIMKTIGRSK